MLEVRGLQFNYNGRKRLVPVLEGVGFQVPEGETWAVIGPSGCGKSTLLFLLAGLLEPNAGRISLDGVSPRERRMDVALILQNYGLFPWKTVEQNVGLGLTIRRRPAGEIKASVNAVLEEMGLTAHRDAYPDQLSGGQKQRVAIARSLVTQPRLLLMDEPFSALDALNREKMQNLLLGLVQKHRTTTLLVTHSIEEAAFLGRKILVFSPLPGRIAEVVDNPGVGREDYRYTQEFWETTTHLRRFFQRASEGGESHAV